MSQYPPIGALIGLTWVSFVTVGCVVYRKYKGKPIFWPSFPNARYSERWLSGFSRKNLLTRLGGARNCLWVAVTDNELRVGPLFPFNMIFLPEIYDLEHCIAGSSIFDVKEGSLFSMQTVSITFERGGVKTILVLAPKDIRKFCTALEQIRPQEMANDDR